MEEGTRDLFVSLVKSSLFALCRNKNLLNTVSKIDGLIGITLENKEVLLINISEYLSTPDGTAGKRMKLSGSGSSAASGNTTQENNEVYVYLNNQEGEDTETAPEETAISLLPSASDEVAGEAQTQADPMTGHSDDGLIDDDLEEWTQAKEKSSKKRKRKRSNKIPILKVDFPDGFSKYMAVDEQPCCKCHPRSSGVCIRCHPEGTKCNASCKNRNCQWRHIQHVLETQGAAPDYIDIRPHAAEHTEATDISPGLESEIQAKPLYHSSERIVPPDPAPSDLESLKLAKEDVLDIYSNTDTYLNFACAIMCEVFTDQERLVECNVQGWAKRPKLDTDPEQKRINAIYNLTYCMYKIPTEERESAKKKIITSIDCRNRHLRFGQQRKKLRESMVYKIERM